VKVAYLYAWICDPVSFYDLCSVKKFKENIRRFIHFITIDIWRIPLEELPKRKSFLYRQLRMILLAYRGFKEDRVQLRASALTYYTMLSFVPVLALIFGIARGFGIESLIQEELMKNFEGQREILQWTLDFAQRMLEMTRGGWIAGIGLLILFWSVLQVLGNIENAFNQIWQISKSRSYVRKLSDYFAILLFAPVLMILAGSFTVVITARISQIAEGNSILGYIGPALIFLIRLAPYVMMWMLFMLLYIVMPNTKVKFGAALLAGIVAGTLYQFVQWGYVTFQVGVSRYNAIYGSFAALPLFMIWVHLSWLIVLFGAELSFAYQNVKQYEFEADTENISLLLYRRMLLLVMIRVVKNFERGLPPPTSDVLSEELKLPVRLVRRVLNELLDAGLVVETVTDNPRERGYVPATDIGKITVSYVLKRWQERGSHHIRLPDAEEYVHVEKMLNEYDLAAERSAGNRLLKEL
jgi:membrane protein